MFSKREIINIILIAITLIAIIVEKRIYEANNYDIRGFHFVCNQSICEVRHTKHNGEIKYVDKINISNIEKFSYRFEKAPGTNSNAMVIYADCKDGSSFKFSPIFIKSSNYLKLELLNPLNNAIKRENISIDIRFP